VKAGSPILDETFRHRWQAEILPARPMILPPRSFVYPTQTEEVERGALEVLVRSDAGEQPFLATCALGFRDSTVPTGLWSCPNPDEICAVSGGYAYIISAIAPERFTMIAFRPVLEVRSVQSENLMLFVGHHGILAWGADGQAWQSPKLSDEGVAITSINDGFLSGIGWNMASDKEFGFTVSLDSGRSIQQ
jgi:hypothetical protein